MSRQGCPECSACLVCTGLGSWGVWMRRLCSREAMSRMPQCSIKEAHSPSDSPARGLRTWSSPQDLMTLQDSTSQSEAQKRAWGSASPKQADSLKSLNDTRTQGSRLRSGPRDHFRAPNGRYASATHGTPSSEAQALLGSESTLWLLLPIPSSGNPENLKETCSKPSIDPWSGPRADAQQVSGQALGANPSWRRSYLAENARKPQAVGCEPFFACCFCK